MPIYFVVIEDWYDLKKWVLLCWVCGSAVGRNRYKDLLVELKMAIILPTGQWYASSAVMNDAGYSIVLHGIALY